MGSQTDGKTDGCVTQNTGTQERKKMLRGVVRHMVNTSTYTPTYAKQITVHLKINVEGNWWFSNICSRSTQ